MRVCRMTPEQASKRVGDLLRGMERLGLGRLEDSVFLGRMQAPGGVALAGKTASQAPMLLSEMIVERRQRPN